jgi:hypothetical protein
MGAVQGQDLEMCKWAVGMRMAAPSLCAVREAIDDARIIRLHILRPTWHLVAAEDVRWMLSTCGERLHTTYMNYWGRHFGVDESDCSRFREAAAKILSGSEGLTMQELTATLTEAGFGWNLDQVKTLLVVGEADGFICNGRQRGRKNTYALLDERVPQVAEISHEEALSRLACAYFRSHSPASKDDFAWWSGLSGTEARRAMDALGSELTADRYEGEQLFVHTSCTGSGVAELSGDEVADNEVHLLPPYDEYLIAYRDRSHVLDPAHTAKAHNSFGIFHPVVMHWGRIVGNWKKQTTKSGTKIETSFFDPSTAPAHRLVSSAIDRYLAFLQA